LPLIPFLLAWALSATAVPAILFYSHKKGLYDIVNERKMHNGNIPRLGGVGIAFGFTLALILRIVWKYDSLDIQVSLFPVVIAGAVIFLLGLVDDLKDIPALYKFLVQLAVGVLLIAYGFRFRVIMVPWGDGILQLGLLSYPITLLWIIGITNAINLIDGIDGLAGGIGAIAAFVFGIFFWVSGSLISAEVCFTLAGAILGFLIFNLPPASIFMGDCGSLFIGFLLSLLPLLGQHETKVEIGLISASTILAVPIFDTLMAIYRRKKANVSFFTADKGHLHHILMSYSNSNWLTLARIYGITLILSFIALSSLFASPLVSFILKIAALGAVFIFFLFINRETIFLKKADEKR